MYDQFTSLFGQQWYSYTVLMMFGVLLSFAWMIWRAPHNNRTAALDMCMGGLIGGVFWGRVLHVLVQWSYFTDHTGDIWRIYEEGGLNWQGVVIGVMIGAAVVARWRGIRLRQVWGDAALLVPMLALVGWWGCGTIGCAYGRTVETMADYPGWLTWAQPDIFGIVEPRFATQRLGVLLAIGLLLLAFTLHWRGWLEGRRTGLLLLLLSAGMFLINFLRGDYDIYWRGLRLIQWLDIGMAVFGLALFSVGLIRAWQAAPPPDTQHSLSGTADDAAING